MSLQEYWESMGSTTKSRTSQYKHWANIKNRCCNENNKDYFKYGARGIKICDRWKNSFDNFYEDMGDKPTPEHQIERIDNNGDYSPENCKWATVKEQALNRRSNTFITLNGKTQTITQWADELGIKRSTLCMRIIQYKWPISRALTAGVRNGKH